MDPTIASWIKIIDRVSHYELLGVPPNAGADAVRKAYHGFAATFHPDAHAHRNAEERDSVNRIFKRGTEAYRVLSDPQLRAYYDQVRVGGAPSSVAPPMSRTGGAKAPERAVAAPPKPGGVASATAGRLEDFTKQAKARPFVQQAEMLAKKGEFAKAKLQLKLAMNMDQGNQTLEQYLKELDVLIQENKNKPYQPK